MDHLFLDQGGVPTLVEVKRATNSEIRRSVVGQMLDYAANAIGRGGWSLERIREDFETTHADPDTALQELLGEGGDGEAFWEMVRTNLSAGRIRMVFVADAIPEELQAIVEFLNEQMAHAEVLALEVKQYGEEGIKTLVTQRGAAGTGAEGGGRSGRSGRSGRRTRGAMGQVLPALTPC